MQTVPESIRQRAEARLRGTIFRGDPAARRARAIRLWEAATLPVTVYFLFSEAPPHPAYEVGWMTRLRLALRMRRTTKQIPTGTSYKAHLAMAAKLLQIPPEEAGVVVECGCFLGGSSANLSLACELARRQLIVYDSFEGLPPPVGNDAYATPEATGMFRGDLDQVRAHVREFGAIERCSFRRGWFDRTLPRHEEPVVLAFFDVDWQASLDDCVRNLWPHLSERGYVFIDEFVLLDYCALFWSESWWSEAFDRKPPGLIGAGSGVGTGGYYLGPFVWGLDATSVAYTRKDFSGHWGFSREDAAADGPAGGN